MIVRLGKGEGGVGMYLFNDVLPGSGGLETDELIVQSSAHGLDTGAHDLEIIVPLRGEGIVGQDLLDDGATASRTHGEFAADEVAEVVDDEIAEVLGTLCDDVVESTDTLAVETEVLGEGLRNAHLHMGLLVEEVAHGPGVLVGGSGGETLVGGVEEGEDLLALTDLGNGLPLLLGGVETGGVVRAGVQKDHVAFLGVGFQGGHHALEVERAGLGLVVGVGLAGYADEVPDGDVVGPGGVGEPDGLGLHLVSEEKSTQVVGASAGDGLDGANAGFQGLVLLAKVLGVEAEHQVPSQLEERDVAFNRGVFVAEGAVFGEQLLLGLADGGQWPGLAIVSAVDTDTETDFVGESVVGVFAVEGEDLVRR